jgi:hypothetical protein
MEQISSGPYHNRSTPFLTSEIDLTFQDGIWVESVRQWFVIVMSTILLVSCWICSYTLFKT